MVICMDLEALQDRYLQEDLDGICKHSAIFAPLYQKTVLITGATGLIGRSLVLSFLCANRLLGTQIRIIASARSKEKLNMCFKHVQDRPELVLHIWNVTDPLELIIHPNYIVHAASTTRSQDYVQHPVETIRTILDGTSALLEYAVHNPIDGMVFLSSMETFGITNSAISPVHEADLGYIDLLNVRSSYPEGKRMAECICAAYASEYGIPVRIARLAQTFGAGTPLTDNRVFAQFAKAVIEGRDIVLHTTGQSSGNYCYISDCIRALLMLLARGERGSAYTVVNEETNTTILTMAQMVAEKIAGGLIGVVFDIPESVLVHGYAPDVTLRLSAEKLRQLSWTPTVGLEEAYFRLVCSLRERIGSL